MKLIRALFAALCIALPAGAFAQNPGLLPSGAVLGNSGASPAPAGAASLSTMFDRAFCSSANASLARISGSWVCLSSAANAVWVTNGSGVPSLSSSLPGGITVPTPVNSSEIANKNYVDANAQGLNPLSGSRLATAAVLPNSPTYSNGTAGVGATLTAGSNTTLTVDGTVASLNDIVLVKNQAAPAQNGQFYVSTVGSGAAPWVLTRCSAAACSVEYDTAATMKKGSYSYISAGATNAGSAWAQSTTVSTVGTDAVSYVLFSGVTVASFNARSGVVTPQTGDYSVGQVTGAAPLASPAFTGTLTQSGGYPYLGSFNAAGIYPRVGTDFAVGWNFSTGGREITFWNTDTAAATPGLTSFVFNQLTGVSSKKTLMTILSNGNVGISNLAGLGSGCPTIDNTGTLTGVTTTCGGGIPSGGRAGDLPYYTSPSTAKVIKSSDANIIAQGGDPAGSTSSSTAANAAYAYSKRIVLPPDVGVTTGTYKFSTDVTFPNGTELIVPCGVTLKPDSGHVVRNNGVTRGGQCQIADTSAGGTVYLGRRVRIDWWPSTGGDDALAFNAADASTVDAAANSADGIRAAIQLSCKGYTFATSGVAHASSTNPQDVTGCGAHGGTVITGNGTFSAGGILVQNGQPPGGSNPDLMSVVWSDFSVAANTPNLGTQCIRLGTSGNAIRSFTKVVIARVSSVNCNIGMAWYNSRNILLEDVYLGVRGDLDAGAAALLIDHVDNNQVSGDSDIVRGQFSCSNANPHGPTGGLGTAFRLKAERTGSNIAGIRWDGVVAYNCQKEFYVTWANSGSSIGDLFVFGGGQCDACGMLGDFSGNLGAHSLAMVQFTNLYLTNAIDMNFTGSIAGTTLTITAISNGGPLQTSFWLKGTGVTPNTLISSVGTCGGSSPTLPCTATVNTSQTAGSTAITANAAQPKFNFNGGNADEIIDILVNTVRTRGGGDCDACRFISAASGALLTVTDNKIASFDGANNLPNELISLINNRKNTINGNTVDADGISGAVNYLISSGGTSDDTTATGNNARGAVGHIFNNSNSSANHCIGINLPTDAVFGC